LVSSSGASGAAVAAAGASTTTANPPDFLARAAARRWLRLALLALLVPLAALIALCVGSTALSPESVLWTLVHPASRGITHTIVIDLRLPRVLIALCVGAGLGVAGALLQALFRNPLVDPYITGVAAGAALAAAVAFTLQVAFAAVPAFAFAGGLGCAAIVALIGGNESTAGNLRLVLAGVAISALCSALVTLVLLRGQATSGIPILSWLAGGINGRGWEDLRWTVAYLGAGLGAALLQVHSVNLLRLGSVAAAGLGLRVGRARWTVLVTASLITAACVAVSGIVGFVGLMVPHVVRRFISGDARWLLAGSALAGASVVVIADVLARSLLPPTEIPLGVLLALVGVPFFLSLTRRPVEL
jgi:iron complex transport system permease protein